MRVASDGAALVQAAADGELWDLPFTVVPSVETVDVYINTALEGQAAETVMPFVIETLDSKKVWFAMNVSCPTGVNVTQSGLVSLMTSGLMFGVFGKKDDLIDRGGPSLGQVGQFRNRRQSTVWGSLQ